jgi:hypothetical protein
LVRATDKDRVVGGIELYGLSHDFITRYVDGAVTDSDLSEEAFVDTDEIARGNAALYAAITIDRLPTNEVEKIRDHLLAATSYIVSEKYLMHNPAASLTIYALGATLGGTAAAKGLGFELFSRRRGRKDNRDLYRLAITKADVEKLSRNYPIIPRLLTFVVNGRVIA